MMLAILLLRPWRVGQHPALRFHDRLRAMQGEMDALVRLRAGA